MVPSISPNATAETALTGFVTATINAPSRRLWNVLCRFIRFSAHQIRTKGSDGTEWGCGCIVIRKRAAVEKIPARRQGRACPAGPDHKKILRKSPRRNRNQARKQMNRADFESIVREHQAMVYSIACNFFHNTALAEDIAQDVFLQLYNSRPAIDSRAHLVSWLRRTTSHRCIDALRHRSMRGHVHLDELPDLPDSASEKDPFLHERLRRLVASLPEKQRMVLVLRYQEDMDVEEIGRMLEMPVRTVWSHLQRAIALLKEKASRFSKEESREPIRQRTP
jgi:RNA polymerase sigma-70 factor (ECF subfamily)